MNDKNYITDPHTRMVNGPVNVMRLEGNVDGIPKVIYLFMDYHMHVSSQTQCKNIFSEDIQKYFVHNFYKLNKGKQMYDFFVEIYPSELAEKGYWEGIPGTGRDHKEKYIEEVVKLFKKIFKYDSRKNKVSINKLFKHVRLHYFDIRDYYKHDLYGRLSEMVNIAHNFMVSDFINLKGLEKIIHLMDIMSNHLKFIVNILEKIPNKIVPSKTKNTNKTASSKTKIIKERMHASMDVQALEYLANKIKTAYKHDYVRRIMLYLIDDVVKNFRRAINEIDDVMGEFGQYVNILYESHNKLIKDENTSYLYVYGVSSTTQRLMMTNIANKIDNILDEKFIEFFARFTDIYFLRRFLDKDYINNAITYTGALHSNTYIYTLVKYFNFKITHASYSKIKNMNKLTEEIKKKSLAEIQELILPEYFDQCSDMKDFPEDFF